MMKIKMYMVEFDIPETNQEDWFDLIPLQRSKVSNYLTAGVILNYVLNSDRTKLWLVCVAENENTLQHLVESLPLTAYFYYNYHELMLYDSVSTFASFSMN